MKIKQIKNVYVKQCITCMLFCLIALCVALIPATFGNVGINMTYKILPIIGDGSIEGAQAQSAKGLAALFGLSTDLESTFTMMFNIGTISYFSILLLDFIFSLFLAITRIQVMRIIFKIYSILAGIAMILILFLSIGHVVGFAGLIIQGVIMPDQILTAMETSAILTYIGMAIFSGLLIGKQFRWFERLY